MVALVLVALRDTKQLEFKLDGIAKFVGLMVLVMFVKLSLMDGHPVPFDKHGFRLGQFKFVWLEDAFFAMIPFYLCKKVRTKFLKFAIWVFFSTVFAYGHVYQGLIFAGITAFYPYFISCRYAKKTTFATVMACHFMFDCFQTVIPKVSMFLQYF